MVNIRTITSKVSKSEAKDLLDKAQTIIDTKIIGPNTKSRRDKLLSKDKTPVKVDGEEAGAVIDKELTATVKTKIDPPKPDARADDIIFKVKSGGKITPKMLDDFNIDKMNSKDDIVKFIDEVSKKYAKDIGKRKRGKQTEEETKALASFLQKDTQKLTNTLLNLKKGDTLNAEYILATRELVEASFSKLDQLANKAITGSPDDVLKFRQHMALTSELTKILKGVQTETARALQQFSIKTSGTNKFGAVDVEKLNKDDFLIEIGGEEEIRSFAKVYLKQIKSGKGRVKAVEGVGTLTNISEAFSEVFINAILSNPFTHVRNTAGNWITQGINQVENTLASRIYGGRQKGGMAKYEDIAKAYGKTQAFQEMWAAIGRAGTLSEKLNIQSMIQGSKVETRSHKFSAATFNAAEGSKQADFIDMAGKILTLDRIPTKFLTVADNYFKNLEYRSELYAMAYRQTLQKIDDGVLKADRAPEYLADLVVNPTKSMTEEAFESAKYVTFQTKMGTRGDFLDLGQILQKLKTKKTLGPANFLVNYYLPFIQTPTNVVGFALERTPGANLLLKKYREDIMGNNPVLAQKAKAKMMTGFAFYLSVMGMNYGGYATGTSPKLAVDADRGKYGMKKTLGIGTGTINIPYDGETYRVNVSNVLFDPVAMMFKQAADLSEILQMGFQDNDEARDYLRMLTSFVLSAGENLASSTFMSGVGKAFNDYQNFKQLGAAKGGERMFQGMVTSTFPGSGFVSQVGKIKGAIQDENNQKLAVEIDEYIKKRLNFKNLNKQYDYLGDEVEGWGVYTKEKKDRVRDELVNTNVQIIPVKRGKSFNIGGLSATVEYTSEELSFLQQRSGQYTKQIIEEELLDSIEYQDADNFLKQNAIKKAVSKAREAAYNDMIGGNNGLGAWEKSEETLKRISDERDNILTEKATTKNFGEPLKNTSDYEFINDQTNDNIDYNN